MKEEMNSLLLCYKALEEASLELQHALVEGNTPDVIETTKKVSDIRNSILEAQTTDIDPISMGSIRGICLRIKHTNEINALLIRRRLTNIKYIKKSLFGNSQSAGYDAGGQSVITMSSMEIIDELA